MNHNRNYTRCFTAAYFTVSLLVAAYVAYRAFHLSFTHDESLSYSILKGNEVLRETANHHVLNTWLMMTCSALWGDSELSLRLPNLLSFVMYVIVCYLLLKMTDKATALLIGIPLLLLNIYPLDFFPLARGYGISMGLMMAGLYFFLRHNVKDHNRMTITRDFILSMLFVYAATWANLNLINFYIGLLAFWALHYIWFAKKNPGTNAGQHFLFGFAAGIFSILLIPVMMRLLFLKQNGQLYYGAESPEDTFGTLIMWSFDLSWCAADCVTYVKYIVKTVFLGVVVFILLKKRFYSPLFRVTGLLLMIVAGFGIEHLFFNTLYPLSRTAVYLVPLFALCVYYLAEELALGFEGRRRKIFLALFTIFFSLPYCLNFLFTANSDHVTEWYFDARSKNAMVWISGQKPVAVTETLQVSANWLFEPTMNYYILSRSLPVKVHKTEGPPGAEIDFVYEFYDRFSEKGWKEVMRFESCGSAIFRREDMATFP